MSYTLGEAAKATGKSKATISKAIKSGKISAYKGDNGTFQIQPSELHRVYPPTVYSKQVEPSSERNSEAENYAVVRELQARLTMAMERLEDKDSVIADLKEDRDRWRQQATALLTSQPQESRKKRWWIFLK